VAARGGGAWDVGLGGAGEGGTAEHARNGKGGDTRGDGLLDHGSVSFLDGSRTRCPRGDSTRRHGVRAVIRPSPERGCATIHRSPDMTDDPEVPQSGELPLIRPPSALYALHPAQRNFVWRQLLGTVRS